MRKIPLLLLLLVNIFWLSPIARADEVRVIFGLALPPYVIKDTATGFELEIVKEALAVKGHTLKPVFAAFPVVKQMLKDKKADGAQRGSSEIIEGKDGFYAAEPTVIYEDYAITLAKNNITINNVADLHGHTIVAYQGATEFIGPAYAEAVKNNSGYQETENQKRQPLMLYAGGIQVAVSDINIFKYFSAQVKDQVDISQQVVFHKIFQPNNAKTNNAVFVDAQIRDDFNAGLKQLKKSGRYQEIIKKYIN